MYSVMDMCMIKATHNTVLIILLYCRAKHPVKVHVWAGISRKGATKVCILKE